MRAAQCPHVSVVRAKRLGGRGGKPGIVKIQFGSLNEKIGVLKSKRNLKNAREFRRTYLCTSKSHIERLVDLNFRAILKELPGGHGYRITGSGRLVKKDDTERRNPGSPQVQNRRRDSESDSDIDSIISPAQVPTPPGRPKRDQRRISQGSPMSS